MVSVLGEEASFLLRVPDFLLRLGDVSVAPPDSEVRNRVASLAVSRKLPRKDPSDLRDVFEGVLEIARSLF